MSRVNGAVPDDEKEFLKDESEKLINLVLALRKPIEERTKRETESICTYLRIIEAF